MNDILENELVKKYFGCECTSHHQEDCLSQEAYNILQAMQEPIRKGEHFLMLVGNQIQEQWRGGDLTISDYHPNHLRLPDRFQKRECEHRHELGGCHKILGCPPNRWDGEEAQPSSQRVEEKMREIANRWYVGDTIEEDLRELVRLAQNA